MGAAECAALKCLIYLCKQHVNTVSRGKANVAAMIYVLQEDVSIGSFCLVTCRMLICKEQVWSLMLNAGKAFSEAAAKCAPIPPSQSTTCSFLYGFPNWFLYLPLLMGKYYVNNLQSEEAFLSLQISVSAFSGFLRRADQGYFNLLLSKQGQSEHLLGYIISF